MKYISFIFLFFILFQVQAQETIQFSSTDDIMVTADIYLTDNESNAFIVLFHQAGWSRGEYLEIAPKLNVLGYHCMAIDQRSGGGINEIKNKTNELAKQKDVGTKYIDALPDMQAALNYVHTQYPNTKVLLWGSSYSAALALVLASQNIEKVNGVLSFSPGEYFERMGKSNTYIQDAASELNIPVFVTSAKFEKNQWEAIYEAIPSENKVSFLPSKKGNHGSRALWSKHESHEEYWEAVKSFLDKYFTH